MDYKKEKALDKLGLNGILSILKKLCNSPYINNDSSQLCEELGILPKYELLLDEILNSLIKEGYLRPCAEGLEIPSVIHNELSEFDLDVTIQQGMSQFPEYAAHFKLLGTCLQSVEQILLGEILATDVMFPEASMELVAGIYRGNEEADYYNQVLCQLVSTVVKNGVAALKPGEKLTIMEIGAGTGGTSESLFDCLAPYSQHLRYLYTDISMCFLLHAERYQTRAPYLETQLFNIEEDPESQGFEPGSCDIIIGANVVHATRNIRRTLNNLKVVMKRGGLILMNELSQKDLFKTLTFGLLDGWWLYEDKKLRMGGSPALSAASWRRALSECGFDFKGSFPKDNAGLQQVVAGISDGKLIKEAKGLQDVEKDNQQQVSPEQPEPQQDIGSVQSMLLQVASDTVRLPVEEINIDDQFTDLGFDSILGTQLVKNINNTLEISLSPTDIFSYPPIETLSVYVQDIFELKKSTVQNQV